MTYALLVELKTTGSDFGLFCPRCGTQTSQTDSKFCRACGVDLTLVSQAMAGQISWRSHLLTKFDNFFLSRREFEERESAREGSWNIFLGTTLSLLSVACLITGEGAWAVWVVVLLFSLVSLKIGVGNLRLYKRYLRGESPPEIRPGKDDLTLLDINKTARASRHSQTKPVVIASGTEKTTELLEKKNEAK